MLEIASQSEDSKTAEEKLRQKLRLKFLWRKFFEVSCQQPCQLSWELEDISS